MWEGETVRTTVKASCSKCGDVSLTIDDVVVRVLVGHEMSDLGQQYRFRCPQCHEVNLKETTLNISNMLMSAGARREMWELPLELIERPTEETAAPINLDDIIDMHLELENDEEWMKKIKGEE